MKLAFSEFSFSSATAGEMEDGTNKTRRREVVLQLITHWSSGESETASPKETEELGGMYHTGWNLSLPPCPAKPDQAFVVKPLGADSGSSQRD